VTLAGPGGSGKTRLALHLAADLTDQDSADPLLSQRGVLRAQQRGDLSSERVALFPDGICFVPLGLVHDPALVTAAIEQALGVTGHDNRAPDERLREALHEQQVLLVLDNFEHLTAAAPLVAELLAAAPRLKVLVTSRVVLRLMGEHIFSVPPLALPPQEPRTKPALSVVEANQEPGIANLATILGRVPSGWFSVLSSVEEFTQYESVRLFVERAKAVNPDFQLTEANAPHVAAICVRLDGLPLAIELAAARSRLLDPQALLDRLGRHGESVLQLLTGGVYDRPARQQTLRDTLAWSYNQLDPKTQRLFRRLAIFAGGATLEAIEAIASEGKIEYEEWSNEPYGRAMLRSSFSILHTLEKLVDHSLLAAQTAATGERRFTMLETIREYAFEQLEASGELEVVRGRHAVCYLALAERAAPDLLGQRQVEWLARIDVECANLRSALEWFAVHDGATGLRIVNALFEFWKIRSQFGEGYAWFTQMLAQAPQPTALRAEALARGWDAGL
jgi:predicted ATPase